MWIDGGRGLCRVFGGDGRMDAGVGWGGCLDCNGEAGLRGGVCFGGRVGGFGWIWLSWVGMG